VEEFGSTLLFQLFIMIARLSLKNWLSIMSPFVKTKLKSFFSRIFVAKESLKKLWKFITPPTNNLNF
jgi:hypothetical protein